VHLLGGLEPAGALADGGRPTRRRR
jgi:hypothetical protein